MDSFLNGIAGIGSLGGLASVLWIMFLGRDKTSAVLLKTIDRLDGKIVELENKVDRLTDTNVKLTLEIGELKLENQRLTLKVNELTQELMSKRER